MKQRALTDKQVEFVVRITSERRRAIKAVREFPTNAEIAVKLGCCQRVIDRISAGHTYKDSRESSARLHDVLVELAMENP
jgi:hypothetical protein